MVESRFRDFAFNARPNGDGDHDDDDDHDDRYDDGGYDDDDDHDDDDDDGNDHDEDHDACFRFGSVLSICCFCVGSCWCLSVLLLLCFSLVSVCPCFLLRPICSSHASAPRGSTTPARGSTTPASQRSGASELIILQ